MKKRTIILISISTLFAIALVYSLFGSYNVDQVVGQQCGLETVVPCIQYDITEKVDLLNSHRTLAVSISAVLFAISLISLLLASFKRRTR